VIQEQNGIHFKIFSTVKLLRIMCEGKEGRKGKDKLKKTANVGKK